MIEVRCGLAEDILPQLPDGSFEVVATDPDYGLPMRSAVARPDGARPARVWDYHLGDSDVVGCSDRVAWTLEQASRLLVPTGFVYMTLSDVVYARAVLVAQDLGFKTRPFAWVKPNPAPQFPGQPWKSAVELVMIAYRKLDMTRRYPGAGRPNWVSLPPPRNRVHPTQKPVGLFRYLIEQTPGRVLDPYCGSGSVLVAAQRLGLDGLGVDKEPVYVEATRRRLDGRANPVV